MGNVVVERIEEIEKLAQGAARRVAGSWPEAVEPDDLTQAIILRLLESPGAFDRIFEEDEPTRKAFLIKVGHQVASKLFQDYEQFSGNYTYDTAAVRGLLDRDALVTDQDRFTPEIADLREGLKNLKELGSNYYADIINRFIHDHPDTYTNSGKVRVNRAVEALTAQMNRIGSERRKNYTEGPGTRKAMSNFAATQLLTSQDR